MFLWHCIRQEIGPKVSVNVHCIRHTLIGLFWSLSRSKTRSQCRIHRFKLCANNFCNPWALHYTGIRSALYQRLHFSNSFIGQMLPWGTITGILREWLFITHQIWDPMMQGHFLLGSHIWYCLLEKKSKCKMFPTFLRNTKWPGKNLINLRITSCTNEILPHPEGA